MSTLQDDIRASIESFKTDFEPPVAPEVTLSITLELPDGRKTTGQMSLSQVRDLKVTFGVDSLTKADVTMLINQLEHELYKDGSGTMEAMYNKNK